MFEPLLQLAGDGQTLLNAVASVTVGALLLITFIMTRSLKAVLGMLLIGGLVLWGITGGGSRWFGDRVKDDAVRVSMTVIIDNAAGDVDTDPVAGLPAGDVPTSVALVGVV